jgi:hypothetical protein
LVRGCRVEWGFVSGGGLSALSDGNGSGGGVDLAVTCGKERRVCPCVCCLCRVEH